MHFFSHLTEGLDLKQPELTGKWKSKKKAENYVFRPFVVDNKIFQFLN